jgi:hypothetical protein
MSHDPAHAAMFSRDARPLSALRRAARKERRAGGAERQAGRSARDTPSVAKSLPLGEILARPTTSSSRPRAAGRRPGRPRPRARSQSVATEVRDNRDVKVERARENVFMVTATGPELSALMAGARLALDAMRASPDAPPTAIEMLARVLHDFDRARERLSEPR